VDRHVKVVEDAPQLLRDGHRPYEVWMLRACLAVGLAGMAAFGGRFAYEFPPPVVQAVWLSSLIIGSVVAQVGVRRSVTTDPVSGLLIERLGLIALGLAMTAYAWGVLAFGGRSGLPGGVFLVVMSIGHWARIYEITTDLRRHRRIVLRR
jgi:hypothetical protein